MWKEYLIERQEDFTIYISKNTAIIQYYNESTGKLVKKSFQEKGFNFKIFHIVKKLKSECELWLMNNEQFHDVRERAMIRYYNYELTISEELEKFYFVDISAAYLTALYNNRIISEYMFNLINELPKKDRLIVLGMLAYEPFKIEYKNGIAGPTEKVRNYYSPVFYKACAIVENIMEDIVKLISDRGQLLPTHSFDRNKNYIFYWVDGLFFKRKEDCETISNYLTEKGYTFRFGECTNLKVERRENHFNLKFNQNDKGKIETKIYNIPYHFQNIQDRISNLKLLEKRDFNALFANFKNQRYGEIKE